MDAIRASIEKLQRKHAKKGITWRLTQNYGSWSCYFSCFRRWEGTKPGDGKAALKEILKLADKYQLLIELRVTQVKLLSFYEELGFFITQEPDYAEANASGDVPFYACASMRRYPDSPAYRQAIAA